MRTTRFEYGCACATTDTMHHVYLKRIPGYVTCGGLEALVDHDPRGVYRAFCGARRVR